MPASLLVVKYKQKDIINGLTTILNNYFEVQGSLPATGTAGKDLNPQQKMYSPEILTKTIKLMNRLLVIDQQATAKKPNDFYKNLLQKKSHDICLQLVEEHPSVDVKVMAMEHLALVTSMPEVFIHIVIDDICKKLVAKAFYVSASSTS